MIVFAICCLEGNNQSIYSDISDSAPWRFSDTLSSSLNFLRVSFLVIIMSGETYKARSSVSSEGKTRSDSRNSSNAESASFTSSTVSPPTSPSISPVFRPSLSPRKKANEYPSPRDDEFAIASDSDVWSLDSYAGATNNFTISSDSYFSHHRDSQTDHRDRGRRLDPPVPLFGPSNSATSATAAANGLTYSHSNTPTSSKKDDRRRSDVSARSIDSTLYSDYNSDSDTPVSKSRRRRRSDSIGNNTTGSTVNQNSSNHNTTSSNSSLGNALNRRRMSSRSRVRGDINSEPPAAKIFRNLLILEESLRQQYEQQQQLRHKYSSFLMIMSLILMLSIYFLATSSTTNSYVHFFYQIVSLISFVTLSLFYLSGEYHKTIVRPRKFLTSTNKGLRQLNIRIIKIRVKRMDQLSDYSRSSMRILASLIKFTLNSLLLKSPLPVVPQSFVNKIRTLVLSMEIRSQPRIGATEVKLVLNSRIFSTATREQWELYRNEFWAKEGSRRRALLLRQRDK